MSDSTPRNGVFKAYRDIKAAGAVPKAIVACWRAVAARIPADGGAVVIGYDDIAKRARCTQRTAVRAVAWAVALGVLGRETAKLKRWRGDYMNAINRYRWIGPPAMPVRRGQFVAFLAAYGAKMSDIGVVENVRRTYVRKPSMTGRTSTGTKGYDGQHRIVAALGMGGQCSRCGMLRPTGRCGGER